MINIRTLKKIENNGGLTLKKGKVVTYKTGWQVATAGIETDDITKVVGYMKMFNGDCGLWYSEGIWYIDKSKRVSTKAEALKIGREHQQQTIYGWRKGNLVEC